MAKILRKSKCSISKIKCFCRPKLILHQNVKDGIIKFQYARFNKESLTNLAIDFSES